jgi:hypothetical protein
MDKTQAIVLGLIALLAVVSADVLPNAALDIGNARQQTHDSCAQHPKSGTAGACS